MAVLLLAGLVIAIGGSCHASSKVALNVSYARGSDGSPLQQMDIYPVDGKTAAPILLFIHGGAWYGGDKSRGRPTGEGFSRQHIVVAVMNYRLAPAFPHPAAVQDAARAIAWLRENASRYGGDPDKIFVAGHSTGGHTAALLATDPKYLRAEGLELSALRGVILLDGSGYDLLDGFDNGSDGVRRTTTAIFGKERESIRDASPIEHIKSGMGIPPFLVFYGNGRDHDQDLGKRANAERIAAPLRNAGVLVRTESADLTHGLIEIYFGVSGYKITSVAGDFIRKGKL